MPETPAITIVHAARPTGGRRSGFTRPRLPTLQRNVNHANQAFTDAFFSNRLEVAAAGVERVDHLRVPLDGPTFLEDSIDLRQAQAIAIGAIVRHRIEGIGDCQD